VAYTEWIDNKKVQVTLADKQTYKSYPKRMLQMRARAFALRDMFPDVLKGLQVREEVEDFVEASSPRDVTPKIEMKVPRPIKGEPEHDPSAKVVDEPASDQAESLGSESQVGARDQRKLDSDPKPTVSERPPTGPAHTGGTKTGQTPVGPEKPDAKAAALAEIAGYSKDTFPEPAHLNQYMKGLKGSDALEITTAYNNKKQELGL
jgi:hypothetical protein